MVDEGSCARARAKTRQGNCRPRVRICARVCPVRTESGTRITCTRALTDLSTMDRVAGGERKYDADKSCVRTASSPPVSGLRWPAGVRTNGACGFTLGLFYTCAATLLHPGAVRSGVKATEDARGRRMIRPEAEYCPSRKLPGARAI